MRIARLMIAAGALTVAALPAAAVDTSLDVGRSDFSVRITGFVPVICHARVSAATVPAEPGTLALGELSEFCNNAAGYRVYADYSPSLVDAKLVVDGQEVVLGEGGSAVVSSSESASIASRNLELQVAEEQARNGSISFRIEPR